LISLFKALGATVAALAVGFLWLFAIGFLGRLAWDVIQIGWRVSLFA